MNPEVRQVLTDSVCYEQYNIYNKYNSHKNIKKNTCNTLIMYIYVI